MAPSSPVTSQHSTLGRVPVSPWTTSSEDWALLSSRMLQLGRAIEHAARQWEHAAKQTATAFRSFYSRVFPPNALERSRAALAAVQPPPFPEPSWHPRAAFTASQHFRRATVWRGHVGWIRAGGRRPLRGHGRRP